MIPLLPKWYLHGNRPTFYDADSVTMLELASTLHGSMNTLIEDYNHFVDNVNNTITEFINATEKDQEVFQVAIRQEFQDFIDIVNLKYSEMELVLNNTITNLEKIARDTVNEAIKTGKIRIEETYDPETESLHMIATGGV